MESEIICGCRLTLCLTKHPYNTRVVSQDTQKKEKKKKIMFGRNRSFAWTFVESNMLLSFLQKFFTVLSLACQSLVGF